ncbi:DUF1758 domain-containing protein [Trichonephila clavata]|uniref:DUF1758 domain-containing protein n=1 Tax=Trichonephila clavata TaxID=2740835 RepID=A0A8X6LW03_TRICU|nr:DUF1758 domain-containing protein [Trichonephila clavata]
MSVSASQKHKNDIILSTCIIYVENSVGEKVPLRVLADSGSQVSLLRSSTADFLNLRKLKTDMSVSGLGGSNVNIKSKIKGVISNGSGSYKRVVDFHVVPKITNMIPVNSFDISHIVFPSNVHLADPAFNISNSIDALLSADIFFDILKDGKYKLDNGNLILQNTEFGYIISGNTSRFSSGSLHCGLITKDFETLNDTLKSFWEIEEIVPTKFVSDELKKCDEHFLKTMARDTNERFCVEMPMKDNDIELGQSKSTAVRRLELLKDVLTENKEFLFNENDELVKTLGLSWRPREDTFMYQMNLQEVPVTITKRTVLSFISKLYDPLGLLQPIIIKAKMMIEKIWLLKIDWDQNLPRQEIENFQRYVAELHQLKDLKIPRCILLKDSVAVQLIGFADASAQAYGACLYVKSENANETQIRLLCSKTRVAPLKTLSIPRLELLAATLLSKLTSKIIKIIDLEFDEVNLFSDSKVVMDWIQMQPHLLKVFVANRLSLIQELTETFSRHHVKTKENPADLISRGATKLQLQDELWWTGPSFLGQNFELRLCRFAERRQLFRRT